MRITYIDKKTELMDLLEKMREFSRRIKEYQDLMIANRMVEMFKRDAENIKKDYLDNVISKIKAEENLNELRKVAEKLREHDREIRENIEDILRDLRYSMGKFIERPLIGIDIRDLIIEIRGIINSISLPKKDFGIMEIKKMDPDEISNFLKEYKSGLLICEKNLSEEIENMIRDKQVIFENKELDEKTIFMVREKKI